MNKHDTIDVNILSFYCDRSDEISILMILFY